jgi:RimJ/RimL family protein N-acetyltransferase
LDDVDAFAAIYADAEVMRFVGVYRPRTREETIARTEQSLRHYAEHGFGMWAVLLRDGGAVVGRCGIEFQRGELDIGWLLAGPCWGKGLATEVAAATLALGLREIGRPIVAVAIAENAASVRIMEKIGMHPDGGFVRDGREHVRYVAG